MAAAKEPFGNNFVNSSLSQPRAAGIAGRDLERGHRKTGSYFRTVPKLDFFRSRGVLSWQMGIGKSSFPAQEL